MGEDCASTRHVRHRTSGRAASGHAPLEHRTLARLARSATRRIAHARHGRGASVSAQIPATPAPDEKRAWRRPSIRWSHRTTSRRLPPDASDVRNRRLPSVLADHPLAFATCETGSGPPGHGLSSETARGNIQIVHYVHSVQIHGRTARYGRIGRIGRVSYKVEGLVHT